MPYIFRHENRKWVIRKKWTGKRVGETDSKSKALAMIRAIQASEHRNGMK